MVDSRRVGLQLRLLKAVLQAARPNEREGVADRASAILDEVARNIGPDPGPELANLLAEVRAEIEAVLREG